MIERAYLITALIGVLVASIDALWHRRGSVTYMRWRPRLVRALYWLQLAALVVLGVGGKLMPFLVLGGCLAVFSLVHRYWYNVQRDMHVDYITDTTPRDRGHMYTAQLLGYHENYGGHVAYIIDTVKALIVAIGITIIQ